MIDRTPAGYEGETVAYLAGHGHVRRCASKAQAMRVAAEEWPEHVRGEHKRGPVHWIEIVDAATFDKEQAEVVSD